MPLVQETILQRIGKALHVYIDDSTREPLPRRWVDLIHHLNDEERPHSEGDQRETKRHSD